MITREFLREVEIFRTLSDEQLERLLKPARLEVYKKGETLFKERDPASRVYVVCSGVIEIGRAARSDGRFLRLTRLDRGEVFGELALFDGLPRSATAVAAIVPETRVGAWDIPMLRALLEEDLDLANRIHRAMVLKLTARLRITSNAVMILLRTLD